MPRNNSFFMAPSRWISCILTAASGASANLIPGPFAAARREGETRSL
jgi:hypothetical protein